MPKLPQPRGPLSEQLRSQLTTRVHHIGNLPIPIDDPLHSDDLQLALSMLYALHYDGFDGVSDAWEWEPSVLAVRARLERRMDAALRAGAEHSIDAGDRRDVPGALRAVLEGGTGRSLSAFVTAEASLDQLRELLVHRSIYQRKEADAHTFALPRLRGVAKAAMVRIQSDEYGEGVPGRSHAELFAATMTELDLDPTPGAYIDQVPAITLATDNLVSLFSLHRAARAELVGHLALFEMTSVTPMGRYAAAIRRLTGSEVAAEFYDVHVAADEVHARWAAEELAAGFVADEPGALAGVLFGAAALMRVEGAFTDHVLDHWLAGRSSLRGAARECRPTVSVGSAA